VQTRTTHPTRMPQSTKMFIIPKRRKRAVYRKTNTRVILSTMTGERKKKLLKNYRLVKANFLHKTNKSLKPQLRRILARLPIKKILMRVYRSVTLNAFSDTIRKLMSTILATGSLFLLNSTIVCSSIKGLVLPGFMICSRRKLAVSSEMIWVWEKQSRWPLYSRDSSAVVKLKKCSL